jgi:hypothetical protein
VAFFFVQIMLPVFPAVIGVVPEPLEMLKLFESVQELAVGTDTSLRTTSDM